jgi:hypothetical protein
LRLPPYERHHQLPPRSFFDFFKIFL